MGLFRSIMGSSMGGTRKPQVGIATLIRQPHVLITRKHRREPEFLARPIQVCKRFTRRRPNKKSRPLRGRKDEPPNPIPATRRVTRCLRVQWAPPNPVPAIKVTRNRQALQVMDGFVQFVTFCNIEMAVIHLFPKLFVGCVPGGFGRPAPLHTPTLPDKHTEFFIGEPERVVMENIEA